LEHIKNNYYFQEEAEDTARAILVLDMI